MGNCCKPQNERGGIDPYGSQGGSLQDHRTTLLRKGTEIPNMKNFKNLRWVDDIYEFYEIGERLGQGSFGTVNKCKKIHGAKESLAIKYIAKNSLDGNPMLPKLLEQELSCL